MPRTRTDLTAFADWLEANHFADATIHLYTHWVRRVLRDVLVITSDTIDAYVRTQVDRRYRTTARAAWRALRKYGAGRDLYIPDFPPTTYRTPTAEPLPGIALDATLRERVEVSKGLLDAVAELFVQTDLPVQDVAVLTWDRVEWEHLLFPGHALLPVPSKKKGDRAHVDAATLRSIQRWAWPETDPPVGAALVPPHPETMEAATPAVLRAWLKEAKTSLSR